MFMCSLAASQYLTSFFFIVKLKKKKDTEKFYKFVLLLPAHYTYFEPRISNLVTKFSTEGPWKNRIILFFEYIAKMRQA